MSVVLPVAQKCCNFIKIELHKSSSYQVIISECLLQQKKYTFSINQVRKLAEVMTPKFFPKPKGKEGQSIKLNITI